MPFRYTDLDSKTSHYKDFIIRRRVPALREVFVLCVAIIIFGLVGASLSVKDEVALSSIMFIFGGGISLYVITQLSRARDLLQATEFENALFASALNMEHTFSFITTADGTMIYYSPGFKERFAAFAEASGHDLKAWIDGAHLSASQGAEILETIKDGSKKELVCHLIGDQEQRTPYRMVIEPIPRPKGFILVRCRPDTSVQEPTCTA